MLFSVNIYGSTYGTYKVLSLCIYTYVPNIFFIITKIGLNIICYIMFPKIMQVPLINLQWEKSPCGEVFLFLMDAIMIHLHLFES